MKKSMVLFIAIVFSLGLWIAIGCDVEDTVKDEVTDDIDTSFEKDVEMEFEPLVYDDTADVQTLDGECGTTSVNEQLEAHDIDLDDVTINKVTLQYVEAKYKNATWTPEDLGQVTCTMWIWGEEAGEAVITETAVKGKSAGWAEIDVNSDAKEVINYYLKERGKEFDYCVECTDGDSHHVEYYIQIGILVEGEHNG